MIPDMSGRRTKRPVVNPIALEGQHAQWVRTYATRSDFLGATASEPARRAAERFQTYGVGELFELGPGQGRDSLFFAAAGFTLTAIDFAEDGLDQIAHKADRA